MAILVLTYDNLAGRFFSQLIGPDQLAPAAVVSGKFGPLAINTPDINWGAVTSGKIGASQIGNPHITDLAADKLTGLIAQARISGLLVSGLMLSGGIQPDDIRFLAGMISRPTAPGCVLDLDFAEGYASAAPSVVYDKSGHNNDGAVTGAVAADGIFGKALSFDGVDDYVDCGDTPDDAPFTLEAWIKPDKLTDEPIILQKGGTFAHPGFALGGWPTAKIRFNIGRTGGETTLDSSITIDTAKFHHIVAIFNGTTMKLYINGVKDPTEATPPSYEPSTEPLWIGANKRSYPNTYFQFDGLIDEVRIYNRALSAEEISGRYIQGLAKLGKLQGSLRLFNSGWVPKINFDPESADLQAISGALRTSGLVYAGSQQVQLTTPLGYITSAFTSGWMGYPRLHSGLIGLMNLINPAMISGLPYANLASGIPESILLSGYLGYKVTSGYPAVGLVGLVPYALISGFLPLDGGTMTGAIAMGTNKITGMGDPTAGQDAATRAYVLAQKALCLLLTGGTMAGEILAGVAAFARRNADDSGLIIQGGESYGGYLIIYGKNHASYPGWLRFLVPNAAKTEYVTAFSIKGATSNPEMTVTGDVTMQANVYTPNVPAADTFDDLAILKSASDGETIHLDRIAKALGKEKASLNDLLGVMVGAINQLSKEGRGNGS